MSVQAPPGAATRRGWLDVLIDLLAVVAGTMLCLLTVLICIDVVARKLGFFTIPWTLDVAEYSLYLVTFLGSPWVLRDGGHIAIDLLVQRLGPQGKRHATLASNIVGAMVSAVLLYYSCRVWWVSFRENVMVHETFVFPEWILLSAAPPTFLILLVVFGRFILQPAGAEEERREGL